jgi:hypothetical protein
MQTFLISLGYDEVSSIVKGVRGSYSGPIEPVDWSFLP